VKPQSLTSIFGMTVLAVAAGAALALPAGAAGAWIIYLIMFAGNTDPAASAAGDVLIVAAGFCFGMLVGFWSGVATVLYGQRRLALRAQRRLIALTAAQV